MLHATLGPPGTVWTAERCGKCCSKMERYRYPSLVPGVFSGNLARGELVIPQFGYSIVWLFQSWIFPELVIPEVVIQALLI